MTFSTAKTVEANGHRYVCRDALGLEIDGRLVRLPEGDAEAVVVGKDGTVYVDAGAGEGCYLAYRTEKIAPGR